MNYRENFGCIGEGSCIIDDEGIQICIISDDYPVINPFPKNTTENDTSPELYRCGKLLYPFANETNNGCWDCGDFKYLEKNTDDTLGLCKDCIPNCRKCIQGDICLPSGCAADKFYHVST